MKTEKLKKGKQNPTSHIALRTSQKGITLIALIITIIVMLILVGVSVTVALNGGLFETAQKATADTELERDKELTLSDGTIEINGKKYLSIEDYSAGIERAPDIMEGKGTETNPYTIDSIEALVQFAYSITNEGKTYEGEYVKLTRNLDFASEESYIDATRTDYEEYGYTGALKTALTTGEGWKPIGTTRNTGSAGNSFAGVFDGNGKIISNLRINKQNNVVTDMGLFTSNLGEIKNLGIKDCNININCSENVNKYGSYGVICGQNYGKINSCWTSGNIEAIYNVGTNVYIGGIAGNGSNSLDTEANISNCYNKTNINVVENSTGIVYVGGICAGTTNMPINNCYNIGNITGEQKESSTLIVGGVLGGGSGTLNSCYNLGQIHGKWTSNTPSVGGVAGTAINVESCCNIGSVTYEGTSAKRVGTLIGVITGQLSDSYSITNAQLNGIGRNGSGASEPTKYDTIDKMPTVLEIVGEAFETDTNVINNGYPILNWQ